MDTLNPPGASEKLPVYNCNMTVTTKKKPNNTRAE